MKYLISFIIVVSLFAFSRIELRDSYAVTRVKQDYRASMLKFSEQLDHFISLLSEKPKDVEIKQAHLKSREAYKAFEYLMAHFDNQSVKLNLNGAPLPYANYEFGQAQTVQPVGLQVIDEIVFSDSIDHAEVETLLIKMRTSMDAIYEYETTRYIDESHIINALRQQIIRIITLGLSGYDTPGSLHAIKEAEVSLTNMLKTFKYFSGFVTDKNDQIFKEVILSFQGSISFLRQEGDFDSLDRLSFIRNHLNPLSSLLLVFHELSGIPYMHEENEREKGLNQKAWHLFDQALLNVDAYASITDELDNKKLSYLGATLFYDESLSFDESMSCATCHLPEKAFTDGRQLSSSNHLITSHKRNTPSLINSAYSQRFFYDLRAHKLDEQIIQVFTNPNEFHADFDLISERLSRSPGYADLFSTIFTKRESDESIINQYTVVIAISAYIKSLASFNSEFDRYMRKEIDDIDESVKQGFNLFMGKAACGTCHFAPLFNGLVPPDFDENESEVLGVPIHKLDTLLDEDPGRIHNGWKHETIEQYRHSFKTVSVRNVEKTAPYMHNGIYETLEEVLEFYNNGGGAGMGIDVPNQTLAADSLNLSQTDMTHIINFMTSLSDTEFDYIVPDTLPRFMNSDGTLSDIRRNKYLPKTYTK